MPSAVRLVCEACDSPIRPDDPVLCVEAVESSGSEILRIDPIAILMMLPAVVAPAMPILLIGGRLPITEPTNESVALRIVVILRDVLAESRKTALNPTATVRGRLVVNVSDAARTC